jgi:hypothetical protein
MSALLPRADFIFLMAGACTTPTAAAYMGRSRVAAAAPSVANVPAVVRPGSLVYDYATSNPDGG